MPPIIEPSLIQRNGGRGGGAEGRRGGAYLLKRQQHTHRILTFKTDRKVLATVTLVPVINIQILKCYQKLKTVRMRKCVRKCLRTNNTTVVQENGLKWKALVYIRGWVLISNLYQ